MFPAIRAFAVGLSQIGVMHMKKVLIILIVLLVLAALAFGLYYFLWTPENLAALGERSLSNGKYDRAVFFYERAAEMNPDRPEYAIALADAWIADDNYTQAEVTLVKAIERAPKTELFCKLSAVFVGQGKLLNAQTMLDGITDETAKAEIARLRPAAPQFSPEGGEYDSFVELTLSGSGTIYYSFTEEYPSNHDAPYSEPIPLEAGKTTVSAVAVSDDGLVSPLATQEYLIVGVVEPVTFASAELEQYIRETLYISRTESVMTDQLWKLEELTVPENVTDYTDLQYFTGLTSLTIHDSTAEDYSFLNVMPAMEKLDLSGCILSADAVSAIGGMTELTELRLSGCGLSNISPFAALSKLSVLDLSDNSISDIAALSGCEKLSEVNLETNAVSTLSSLSGLGELVSLNVSGNAVDSLEPIAACTKLETLRADDNALVDVQALKNMTALRVLSLSGNSISDAAALSACTKLEELNLSDNAIVSVDVIAQMQELKVLNISHNQVKALPQLSQEAHLQQVRASYNVLSSVSVLAGLTELTYVDVDYNEEVEDVECLSTCPLLVQVNAFGTKVKEVKKLTDMSVIVNYNPAE